MIEAQAVYTTVYAERRAQIWMVQVRRRGSDQAWSATSARWFNTRKETWDYIAKQIAKPNFEYYEYRPMRYLPVEY